MASKRWSNSTVLTQRHVLVRILTDATFIPHAVRSKLIMQRWVDVACDVIAIDTAVVVCDIFVSRWCCSQRCRASINWDVYDADTWCPCRIIGGTLLWGSLRVSRCMSIKYVAKYIFYNTEKRFLVTVQ